MGPVSEIPRTELIDPLLPDAEALAEDVKRVLEGKWLSNGGPYVRTLEQELARRAGRQHAAAVSSATLGLMVALRALDWSGEVILPAFTFPATAHAVVWAGLEPVLADVDPETWTLDPASAARVRGPKTAGVQAVNAFGVPPDVDSLHDALPGLPILVDDAHGSGSRRPAATPPACAVGSLHATKSILAGEGGVVFTDDDILDARIRRISNFGMHDGRDCDVVGLNAKMPELSAVLALHTLPFLDRTIEARRAWAAVYVEALSGRPGVSFQRVPADVEWNAQFFGIDIDVSAFGASRDEVRGVLDAHGVVSRAYFHPAIHEMTCYRGRLRHDALPVSEALSRNVLCLPLRADSDPGGAAWIGDLVLEVAAAGA